jgi:hypothetical protein
VALAQTHSAYQRVAEMALYDTIYIDTTSNNSFKCLKTLAKNPEKAALVRFLTFEYYSTNRNRRVTKYLFKSLVNMDSLSDFRARTYYGVTEVEEGLVRILWLDFVKF